MSVKEAKDRVLAHRVHEHEKDVQAQNEQMSALHAGVTEFIDAMKATYPPGIVVPVDSVFSDTSVLPSLVKMALKHEYEYFSGVSLEIMLLAADRNGQPGITLALINLNRNRSDSSWIKVSADLRTEPQGIGFHIYTLPDVNERSLGNKKMIDAELEEAKGDDFKHTKVLLKYAKPMLVFAEDMYKKTVDAEIAKSTPR